MLAIHAKYGIETIYGEDGSRPEPPKDGTTSARARALAWRFQHANEQLIALIEPCTPQQWRAICADTGWTIGVQAHHIAAGEAPIAGTVRNAVSGHPHPPLSMAMLDEINDRHAREFADVTVAETIALLRSNGALAIATYREVSDAQLDLMIMPLEGSSMSVAAVIEALAIGEIERHGAYIRNALGLDRS